MSCASFILHQPYVIEVNLPCSAVNKERSHSVRSDPQVGNVLLREPYSQLGVGYGSKFTELDGYLQQGLS